MKPSERILRRDNVIHECKTKVRNLNKKELYSKLQAAGISTKGKPTDLLNAATNLRIPITEEYQVQQKDGWAKKNSY